MKHPIWDTRTIPFLLFTESTWLVHGFAFDPLGIRAKAVQVDPGLWQLTPRLLSSLETKT